MKKYVLAFLATLCISATCMAAPPSYATQRAPNYGGMGHGGHMPPLFYSGNSNGTIRTMPNYSGGYNYYDNGGYAGRSTQNAFGGQTFYGISGYQPPLIDGLNGTYGGNGQYGQYGNSQYITKPKPSRKK